MHYTETFLLQIEGVLSDADLASITQILANDPGGSEPSEEVENLRFIFWPLSKEGSRIRKIWYLTYPGLPHVEVVAFTDLEESNADPQSTLKVL